MRKIFLSLLIILSLGLPTINIQADDLPKATTNPGEYNFNGETKDVYNLISPIGSIKQICDKGVPKYKADGTIEKCVPEKDYIPEPGKKPQSGFSNFVNGLIKILIALGGAITVVMIMVFGVQYMISGTSSGKSISKDRIVMALGGLILIFCSYLILNTINPDLVNIKIGGFAKINESSWETYSPGAQYRLEDTVTTSFERTKHYDKIKSIAQSNNIPHCALQVIVQRESRGNESVIGHDENAPNPKSIPARRKFIESGVKFNGEKFVSTTTNLGYSSNFLNNDHKTGNIYSSSDPSKADLGLDWRFSHGIGLMQFTFFPDDNGKPKCRLTSKTKTEMCPKDMMNPDKALKAGSELFAYYYDKCKGDVENTFKAYGSGNCNTTNTFAVKESRNRKNLYDQCVAQDK